MHTHEELVSCLADIARRAGDELSADQHCRHDEEFRLGRRTEVRRTINDSPLAAVAFLEELRRAAEEAQSGLISNMGSTAAAGPTMTDLGAALGISKQSGRKRVAAAAKWSEEHDLPDVVFTIEELALRYPSGGPHLARTANPGDTGGTGGTGGTGESAAEISWPVDDSPHPDQFGNTPRTQEQLAQRAFAMGIGIGVNR